MEIVKCTKAELREAVAFYDSVTAYLEETVNYPRWTRGEYPGPGSIRRAVEDGTQYLCREDGSIVGAFILNADPQGRYDAGDWQKEIKEGAYLVIHALAADPGKSRSGIGSYMTEYCIREARERGYRAVRLDVVPDNFPARSLYEKKGFRFAGEKDLGRGIDAVPRFALYEINF